MVKQNMKSFYEKMFLFLIVNLIINFNAFPQPYPIYNWPDTAQIGDNISRTLNLLRNSNPEEKTTVKILVYGQSINEQEWWLDVKNYIENLYPNAKLEMKNLSIGGFQAIYLNRTVDFDSGESIPRARR